jgi:protein-tyrosine-phosphatase
MMSYGMVIQFICRGNAFRSIIAEAYLKSLKIPGVSVLSTGTVASQYKAQNSTNFPRTLALLKMHGIEQYAKDHYADDIKQSLLDESDIVICLNKIAYDEAASSFKLPEKTYVWDVVDLSEEGRIATTEEERDAYMEDVYDEIVNNVNRLVNSRERPSYGGR